MNKMSENFSSREHAWYQFIFNEFGLSEKQCQKEALLCRYHFFEIEKGKVKTKISRGKQKPVYMQVLIEVISFEACRIIESEIIAQPLLRTKLLSGQLPNELEVLFEKHKLSLVPKTMIDFDLKIADADARSKRLYVACLMGHLIEEAKKDPYLFFLIRGFNVEQLKRKIGEAKERVSEPITDPKLRSKVFWGESDLEGFSKSIEYCEKDVLKEAYVKLPFLAINHQNLKKIYEFLKIEIK